MGGKNGKFELSGKNASRCRVIFLLKPRGKDVRNHEAS